MSCSEIGAGRFIHVRLFEFESANGFHPQTVFIRIRSLSGPLQLRKPLPGGHAPLPGGAGVEAQQRQRAREPALGRTDVEQYGGPHSHANKSMYTRLYLDM